MLRNLWWNLSCIAAMDFCGFVARQLHPQFWRNTGIGKGAGERMACQMINCCSSVVQSAAMVPQGFAV
jgi:hypothetical protein